MIRRIQVQNFQNHERSVLDLAAHVNVISGPSDNGKSAIVRALRWVIENKPLGDSFCRTGTKDTSVLIDMGDVCVERFRNGRNNGYRMGEETFLATKGTVPTEIAAALDIAPPCLQNQTDPYYLLSLSPGEVARHLSQLADLSDIDAAIRKANSLIGKTQVEAKFAETEIASLESKLKDSEHLDAIEVVLRRVGTALERSEAKLGKWADLDALHDETYATEEAFAALPSFVGAEGVIADLKEALAEDTGRRGVHVALTQLRNQVRTSEQNLQTAAAVEKKLGDHLTPLIEAIKAHTDKVSDQQGLAQHCTNIDIIAKQVKQADDAVAIIEKELAALRGTLDTCPTCGATMVQDAPATAPRRRP